MILMNAQRVGARASQDRRQHHAATLTGALFACVIRASAVMQCLPVPTLMNASRQFIRALCTPIAPIPSGHSPVRAALATRARASIVQTLTSVPALLAVALLPA